MKSTLSMIIIIVLFFTVAVEAKSFNYLICPETGSVNNTYEADGRICAASEMNHSKVIANLRYESRTALVVHVNAFLKNSTSREYLLNPSNIHLFEKNGDVLEKHIPNDWLIKKKRTTDKETFLNSFQPLIETNITPGENKCGAIYFKRSKPDWLMLSISFADEEHVFAFRKKEDKPCVPEDLSHQLIAKLQKIPPEIESNMKKADTSSTSQLQQDANPAPISNNEGIGIPCIVYVIGPILIIALMIYIIIKFAWYIYEKYDYHVFGSVNLFLIGVIIVSWIFNIFYTVFIVAEESSRLRSQSESTSMYVESDINETGAMKEIHTNDDSANKYDKSKQKESKVEVKSIAPDSPVTSQANSKGGENSSSNTVVGGSSEKQVSIKEILASIFKDGLCANYFTGGVITLVIFLILFLRNWINTSFSMAILSLVMQIIVTCSFFLFIIFMIIKPFLAGYFPHSVKTNDKRRYV